MNIPHISVITRHLFNDFIRHAEIFTIISLSLIIGVCTIALPTECDAKSIDNTIFLPLKINSPKDTAELTKRADDETQKILETFGITLFPRTEAEDIFDYSSWPPSFSTLQALPSSNQKDYVVVGSLTHSGSKISVDVSVYDLLDESAVKFFFLEGNAESGLSRILNSINKDIITYTNRQAIIAKIVVAGNKKIDSGAVLQKISLEEGDPYDKNRLRDSLKEIFKLGYFDDIKIKSKDTDKGKEITFQLSEKAIIGQVIIEGEDEIETDDILEVVELLPNNIISVKDVQDSVAQIKELYKQEGYYNTKVTSKLTTPKEGRVDVTFKIKEGSKVYIKDIKFTGNQVYKNKKLNKIIQTSEKGWLSWLTDSGVLNNDLIEQDAARISAFYHNNGYIEAKVGKPEITQKGDWFYVNFEIQEGQRYKVGTVDLKGELIEEKAELLALTNLVKEKYFSRKVLREDILSITDRYAEKGYAFAEAAPNTDKDIENKRVNITIDIAKKELIHINRIIIRGNSRTRDKVIRREIKVKETGIFNATALKTSQKKLQRLDFFEDIKIDPQPSAKSDEMDIVVNVKEKATGNFSIGAGYSSVNSFMFMSEISQNNFLGKGQKVSLQANLSKTSTQYNLSFTEPHLADSKLLVGIDLYNWTREYDDYDKESQGVGLRFGYPIGWKWRMFGGYSFDDTILTDVISNPSQDILDSMEINITSAVKIGFARDTRNKFTDATSGSMHSFNVKYAGGILSGDAEFTKFDASTNYYHALPWDTSLHNKLAAGWAFANSSNKLPVFEKYYLGGINNIRGFKSGNISPVDPLTNEKVGGGKMWYYNLEWIFPLVEEAGLKGLLFFDAGNVYDEDTSWEFGTIKKSVGFGFRWLSPMGPLRLEWGYNLDPTPEEVQDSWDFSMGGSF